MIIEKVTMQELADILERETIDDVPYDYEDFQINVDNDPDYILTVGKPYYIEQYGILVIEGLYYTQTDDELMPDWDATVVYEWDGTEEFTEEDAQHYAYFEQGTIMSAIHNYLTYKQDVK